jgi:hypothetical protein
VKFRREGSRIVTMLDSRMVPGRQPSVTQFSDLRTGASRLSACGQPRAMDERRKRRPSPPDVAQKVKLRAGSSRPKMA